SPRKRVVSPELAAAARERPQIDRHPIRTGTYPATNSWELPRLANRRQRRRSRATVRWWPGPDRFQAAVGRDPVPEAPVDFGARVEGRAQARRRLADERP